MNGFMLQFQPRIPLSMQIHSVHHHLSINVMIVYMGDGRGFNVLNRYGQMLFKNAIKYRPWPGPYLKQLIAMDGAEFHVC